jgi:hypothetical protein
MDALTSQMGCPKKNPNDDPKQPNKLPNAYRWTVASINLFSAVESGVHLSARQLFVALNNVLAFKMFLTFFRMSSSLTGALFWAL